MRLYVGLFAIAIFIVLIDFIFYKLFLRKSLNRKRYQRVLIPMSLSYLLFWAFLFIYSPKTYSYLEEDNYSQFFIATSIFIVWYLPRLVAILIKLLFIIPDALKITKSRITSIIALSTGALLLIGGITGIFINRFQFRIIEENIVSSSVPKSFNNYKVVQISDLHLGTAKSQKERYNKMVDMINNQNPDMVVFTGDIVNNFATELEGWQPILSQINAKDGVFAVLGNHDYGDYVKWETPQDKQRNNLDIVDFFEKVGWKLLRNEYDTLIKNSDTIIISGVENWGHPPFPQYGDLKASTPINSDLPIILLSHDPSHWDGEVKDYPADIFLTLSGHTHGFQFGIRSKNINISPVTMRYEKWGGLYQENNKQLYVNIGAGTIGFPGRIGMRPEITVLTLKTVD
ncbi:MAG: phosphoesterase [Salinivirgaceae bacterium]|nr:MAG: phosphoesterase [Salinivirgaceae bacterium]